MPRPQVRAETVREVEDSFRRYEEEVAAAGLRPVTVTTYIQYASQFVRWLKGDFVPGGTLPGRR